MATLYRTYRPTTFVDVVGQDHVTGALTAALEHDKTAHAYLFHGPRGVGKTTTARIIAARLTCTKAKGAQACGKCSSCKATAEKRNIDIIEIDAASNRGIDDIRTLQDKLTLAPTLGERKVYIIDEVHMLTKEAFTALLKTLEEPLSHVVFILATTEFHKVPDTIISRCQVFRFRRGTSEAVTSRLQYLLKKEKRTADADALAFIVARSDGCYRDAESLLGQALALHKKKVTMNDLTDLLGLPPHDLLEQFVTALASRDAHSALTIIDESFARGFDPEQFLAEAIRLARQAAVAGVMTPDAAPDFAKAPEARGRLPQIIRALIQAGQDLAVVPEPLIALHLAVLSSVPAEPVNPARPARQHASSASKSSTPPRATQTSQPMPVKMQPAAAVSNPAKIERQTPAPQQGGDVANVRAVWPQLIEAVKGQNPVAATFLRAMEPASREGNVVRIQAFYALHRNFFEKDANRAPIEAALGRLLEGDISVRCFFDEAGSRTAEAPNRKAQEAALLSSVKEVFGTAAK